MIAPAGWRDIEFLLVRNARCIKWIALFFPATELQGRLGIAPFANQSTRTQPLPTSNLLSRALDSELANSAMTVGYSRRTGERSRLDVNAAYAPSEYAFGGSVLGVTTDELGQQLELEAMWSLSF